MTTIGFLTSGVAARAGVSGGTVTAWRRRFGVSEPRSLYSEDERREFAEKVEEIGVKAMAELAGVAISTDLVENLLDPRLKPPVFHRPRMTVATL